MSLPWRQTVIPNLSQHVGHRGFCKDTICKPRLTLWRLPMGGKNAHRVHGWFLGTKGTWMLTTCISSFIIWLSITFHYLKNFFRFIYFTYMSVFSAWICTHHVYAASSETRSTYCIPWSWNYRRLWTIMLVLGTVPGPWQEKQVLLTIEPSL